MELVEQPHYFPYPALDAPGYARKIEYLLSLYPWEIQLAQLNLLSSHDVARIYSVVGEDEASVVLSMLLLLTFPGAPSLYYGDEVGLLGELDPDCRRTFPAKAHWHQGFLQSYKDLIALRYRYPALRIGQYAVLHAEQHVYSFARILEEERVVVAVNTGTTAAWLDKAMLSVEVASLQEEFTFQGATWDGDRLHLPPRSAVVMVERA
jgi:glycosidase